MWPRMWCPWRRQHPSRRKQIPRFQRRQHRLLQEASSQKRRKTSSWSLLLSPQCLRPSRRCYR
ncbi:hypothetical protein BD414DRAFT_495032 [Trametes punicea]|nr:hypothetical protein BD414DRAFT_495032 [Trametes punicea]